MTDCFFDLTFLLDVKFSVILFVFICTAILIRSCHASVIYGSTKRRPHGPVGFPIVGHLPWLGNNAPNTLDAMSKKYGSVFRIRMGSRPAVVVSGSDAILNVIVRQGTDFAGRPDFLSWKLAGDGEVVTFVPYSASWALQKKLMLKAIHLYFQDPGNALQLQVSREAKMLVSSLLEKGREGVNPGQDVEFSAASIIYSLCLGGTGQLRQDEGYLKWFSGLDLFSKAAGNYADVMPWLTPLVSRTSVMKRFSERHRQDVALAAENYRKHEETFDPRQIRDVTDALIKVLGDYDEGIRLDSAQLSAERVMHMTLDIMGAGLVTVSVTLLWAILYVTKFLEVQQRVQKELDDVIGDSCPLEIWNPEDFPYTMATLLETLRCANINPFLVPHETIRDTTLNGFSIDNGTMVFCNMYSVFRDASIWRNPLNFDPGNFLDSTGKSIDPSKRTQLLAFGAGRRRCPGKRIAEMELLMMFASLLHSCILEPTPGSALDLDPDYAFSLVPKAYRVKIRSRKSIK